MPPLASKSQLEVEGRREGRRFLGREGRGGRERLEGGLTFSPIESGLKRNCVARASSVTFPGSSIVTDPTPARTTFFSASVLIPPTCTTKILAF